jgi:recombination protein RecA
VIYGSPEVTSGGNALKFYASIRLDTRRKEVLPENKGIRIKVKVVKNKVAAPFKVVMLDINFGSGIDSVGCMLDAALDLGIVERRGSWYAYEGKQLAQGRHNVVELVKGNELGSRIENDVRLALANYGKDGNVQDAAIEEDEVDMAIPAEEESYLE